MIKSLNNVPTGSRYHKQEKRFVQELILHFQQRYGDDFLQVAGPFTAQLSICLTEYVNAKANGQDAPLVISLERAVMLDSVTLVLWRQTTREVLEFCTGGMEQFACVIAHVYECLSILLVAAVRESGKTQVPKSV